MEDVKTHCKFDHAPFIKNMFFQDKKKNYYLVIQHVDTPAQKEYWRSVGTSSGNVSPVREEKLNEILKVVRGSVNPFSLLNDTQKVVKYLIVDNNLMNHEFWSFHPSDNKISLEFKREEFLDKFLGSIQRTSTILDLTKAAEEKPTQAE